jgi:hypothetical protein
MLAAPSEGARAGAVVSRKDTSPPDCSGGLAHREEFGSPAQLLAATPQAEGGCAANREVQPFWKPGGRRAGASPGRRAATRIVLVPAAALPPDPGQARPDGFRDLKPSAWAVRPLRLMVSRRVCPQRSCGCADLSRALLETTCGIRDSQRSRSAAAAARGVPSDKWDSAPAVARLQRRDPAPVDLGSGLSVPRARVLRTAGPRNAGSLPQA